MKTSNSYVDGSRVRQFLTITSLRTSTWRYLLWYILITLTYFNNYYLSSSGISLRYDVLVTKTGWIWLVKGLTAAFFFFKWALSQFIYLIIGESSFNIVAKRGQIQCPSKMLIFHTWDFFVSELSLNFLKIFFQEFMKNVVRLALAAKWSIRLL